MLDEGGKETLYSKNKKSAIDCKTLQTFIKKNKSNITETIELLYMLNNHFFDEFLSNDDNKIDVLCKDSIIKSVIFLIQNNEHYLQKIMPELSNNYNLHAHSFDVMVYSLHIGNLLKYSYGQLLKLGEAALLHDIGEKKTDYIFTEERKLDMDEMELTKKHTENAIQILMHNNIKDPYVTSAIEQHHERYDGSGYPNHLQRFEINDFASILAVADVFDALTIDRPYRKKYTTFESLKLMMQDSSMKDKFNHDYIKLLLA